MKYFFIALFFCFYGSYSSVKAGVIISDNVTSFTSNDHNLVYVRYIDDKYKLYLDNQVIVTSSYSISYPSIDKYGTKIVFSGISILNENRYCISILDGKKNLCNDMYLYDIESKKIDNLSSTFNGNTYISKLSGDGRYVAFESSSSNITSDYVYSCSSYKNDISRYCSNIYKLDLLNNKFTLVSKRGHSGRYDSMEPSINYDGSVIVFRSMESFFEDKKYCYSEYYDRYSYCSIIYMYRYNVLSQISDYRDDSYNGYVSGNYVSFDSYSTHDLFDYHYQNSTFLYDIDNDKYSVINKSPNRVINNVMLSNDAKFNLSVSSSSNMGNSSGGINSLIVSNVSTNKSLIVNDTYNYDVIDAYIFSDNSRVYFLSNNKLVYAFLSSSGPSISSNKNLTIVKGKDYDLFKYVQVEDVLDKAVDVYVKDYSDFNDSREGRYTITLAARDSYGNETYYDYVVEVIDKDIESPIFIGESKYSIYVNDKKFRLSDYISVYDNVDDGLSYSVVKGKLDISESGTYNIVLKAEDSSSNVTYFNVKIIVKEKGSSFVKSIGALCVVVCLMWYIMVLKKK